jgi:DDE superfamily endonuclease
VTGLLSTSGSQFQDWSAAYRLLSQARLHVPTLFTALRSRYLECLPESAPLCISLDDSLLPKCGTKIPGASWRRDPQGPPFQTNLIRAQRVLQFSALLPLPDSPAVRGIPIDFLHTPTASKLKPTATEEEKKQHKQLTEQLNLAQRALDQLQLHRASWGARRPILLSDARFTTRRFLNGLPADVTLIGRIRKDAKLFYPPTEQPATGHPLWYGEDCPTPQQIRQDRNIPWQQVRIHASGADHDFRIKVVEAVLWRPAGPRVLRLIIIAPLGYRPRKGSRVLYRDAAYLICTDTTLAAELVVQYYLWRWDIEVNFREEKTLLGVGEPQVRNPQASDSWPAFQVAVYAMLLLAAARSRATDQLPVPKWRAGHKPERISTQRLIQNLRSEVWGRGLGLTSFSGFCSDSSSAQKPEKLFLSVASAVCYG